MIEAKRNGLPANDRGSTGPEGLLVMKLGPLCGTRLEGAEQIEHGGHRLKLEFEFEGFSWS